MATPDEVMAIPDDHGDYGYSVYQPQIDTGDDFCFMCNYATNDVTDSDFRDFTTFLNECKQTCAPHKLIQLLYEYYELNLRQKLTITYPGMADAVAAPEWTKKSIERHLTYDTTDSFDFQFQIFIQASFNQMHILKDNMVNAAGTRLDYTQVKLYHDILKNIWPMWEKTSSKKRRV